MAAVSSVRGKMCRITKYRLQTGCGVVNMIGLQNPLSEGT